MNHVFVIILAFKSHLNLQKPQEVRSVNLTSQMKKLSLRNTKPFAQENLVPERN
jgi:hypothetical protein